MQVHQCALFPAGISGWGPFASLWVHVFVLQNSANHSIEGEQARERVQRGVDMGFSELLKKGRLFALTALAHSLVAVLMQRGIHAVIVPPSERARDREGAEERPDAEVVRIRLADDAAIGDENGEFFGAAIGDENDIISGRFEVGEVFSLTMSGDGESCRAVLETSSGEPLRVFEEEDLDLWSSDYEIGETIAGAPMPEPATGLVTRAGLEMMAAIRHRRSVTELSEGSKRREQQEEATLPPDRPKPSKTTRTHRFNDLTYAEARELAEKMGMSVTAFIEEAIREKVARTLNDPRQQELIAERVALQRAEEERNPPPSRQRRSRDKGPT